MTLPMTLQLLDFLDPNDRIPTWAIALACAVLSLAATLPTPESPDGPTAPTLGAVTAPAGS